MDFSLDKSLEVLEHTPEALSALLRHLSIDWTDTNEGENTWTVKEVIAHLILCEKTNWMVRANIMLSDDPTKTLHPIDMTAHFELSQRNSLEELIEELKQLRRDNIRLLKSYQLKKTDLLKTAMHPKLGPVNLQQLLATWVAHDLSHTAQIARIMAKQCKPHVGPFAIYLNILKS